MSKLEELQGELEVKKRARDVYRWIQRLSVISVPWFIFNALSLVQADVWERFWAAALPALPHLFVLLAFNGVKQHAFVRAHARQAMALVAARMLSAFVVLLLIDAYVELAVSMFLLVNGGLWLFGSANGIAYVQDGKFRSLQRAFPYRTIRALEEEIAEFPANQKKEQQARAKQLDEGHGLITAAEESLAKGEHEKAVELLGEAFRAGGPSVRAAAAVELQALGLVETF